MYQGDLEIIKMPYRTVVAENDLASSHLHFSIISETIFIKWKLFVTGWSRLELTSEIITLPDISYVEVELVLKGLPFSEVSIIYLIYRSYDKGDERAFVVASGYQMTGASDRVRAVIAVNKECQEQGRWTVGLQNESSLELALQYSAVRPIRDASLLNYWPPGFDREYRRNRSSSSYKQSIVICVHNSWNYSHDCINSVLRNRSSTDHVVIVNDGSSAEVGMQLRSIAASNTGISYLEDRTGSGYTKAVNRGVLHTETPFIVLLNSDTIVPPSWTERLLNPFSDTEKLGILGPLSNRATLQSVPLMEEGGGWAKNTLVTPENLLVCDEMVRMIAERLGQKWIDVDFVNGFCLAVKREVFEEIGFFDEYVFSTGYGEETDFEMRARDAAWKCGVVPNVLVYHLGSASYESYDLQRYQNVAFSSVTLKHGLERVMGRFRNSRDMMQSMFLREILSLLLRSQQILQDLGSAEVAEGERVQRVKAILDLLLP